MANPRPDYPEEFDISEAANLTPDRIDELVQKLPAEGSIRTGNCYVVSTGSHILIYRLFYQASWEAWANKEEKE